MFRVLALARPSFCKFVGLTGNPAVANFGYAASLAPWIGLVLLVATIVMLIPRTAVLGCILVTGYLGGATATQVRAQDALSFLKTRPS